MRTSQVRRAFATALAAVVLSAGLSVATAAPALAATSQVFVVHGIPGQPVDVYVNGARKLSDFQPGTVAGPLTLPAGSYDLALTKPGEQIGSAILKLAGAAVPGGANLSIVAHLDGSGAPKITAFANDVSRVPAGKARIIVRHAAAAPAVDIRAAGAPIFTRLANLNEAMRDIDAGTVSADVVLAGTPTVVIGPKDLNLAEGTATIVYAIGSAEGKSLNLVAQVIKGLQDVPAGIESGDGGLADTGVSAWWYALLAVAVAAVLIFSGRRRLVTGRAER